MRLELCIENLEGALLAKKYGFDSVELNSALALGGMTPPIGLVRKVCEIPGLEVNCMIRNRACGFLYSNEEYEEMKTELYVLLEEDVNGIVFGFLNKNFEIDTKRCKEFVEAIHKKGKKAIFHRAFDNCKDFRKSFEDLIECGVDRLLTSGLSDTAIEGIDVIKELVELSNGRIDIVAGSGINSHNIKDFAEKTKISYAHASCKGFKEDNTTKYNVDFRVFNNNKYQISDEFEIKKLVEQVRS